MQQNIFFFFIITPVESVFVVLFHPLFSCKPLQFLANNLYCLLSQNLSQSVCCEDQIPTVTFFLFLHQRYMASQQEISRGRLYCSFLSEHLHQLSVLTIWMNYLVFTQFNHLLLPAKDYDHVLSACVRHVVGPAQSTPHTVTVLAFGDEQDQEKIFVAVPERGNKAV